MVPPSWPFPPVLFLAGLYGRQYEFSSKHRKTYPRPRSVLLRLIAQVSFFVMIRNEENFCFLFHRFYYGKFFLTQTPRETVPSTIQGVVSYDLEKRDFSSKFCRESNVWKLSDFLIPLIYAERTFKMDDSYFFRLLELDNTYWNKHSLKSYLNKTEISFYFRFNSS